MKRSRFDEEQIIRILKEQEAGLGTADLCRKRGISSATFYKWKTKLAEAIRYALARWQGLTRFLDDGRIEIDSNVVERTIRPIAISRPFCPCRVRCCRPLSLAPASWAAGALHQV